MDNTGIEIVNSTLILDIDMKTCYLAIYKKEITEPVMDFSQWVRYLRLRFETLFWQSSLDSEHNQYLIIRDGDRRNSKKVGIKMAFPFSMHKSTFLRKIGPAARNNILTVEVVFPNNEISFPPPSNDYHDRTRFIIIRRDGPRLPGSFKKWVHSLIEIFQTCNAWEHNIKLGKNPTNDQWTAKAIRLYGRHQELKINRKPVGVVVTFPFEMCLDTFTDKMNKAVRTMSYYAKTPTKISTQDLNKCLNWGFFREQPE